MWIRDLITRSWQEPTTLVFDTRGGEVPDVRDTYARLRRSLAAYPVGTVIGIRLEQGHAYFLTTLACMELGIPYVPMGIDWPEPRVEQVGRVAGVAEIIDRGRWEQLAASASAEAVAPRELAPSTPLYIIFTSGTTGEPKGVLITRGNYAAYLNTLHRSTPLPGPLRLLLPHEFTFDAAQVCVGLFILNPGCAIRFSTAGKNMFKLAMEISNYRAGFLALPPTTWAMLASEAMLARYDFSSLRVIVTGGARMGAGAYHQLKNSIGRHAEVHNQYGPTECTVMTHAARLSFDPEQDVVDDMVTIGYPCEQVSCRLVAADGSSIEDCDTEGELLIAGPQLMAGYIGRPDQTAQSITEIDGTKYYRTNDIAVMDRRGRYFIKGRNDDTIKRRAYRINLSDIDSYAERLQEINACATIAVPDEAAEHRIVAFVRTEPGVDERLVARRLKESLLPIYLPDEIITRDSLPTSANGKVDKRALLELYQQRAAARGS